MELGDAYEEPHFPWDRLPRHLQESILALLPVSTLLSVRSVSRSALATLSSSSFLRLLSSRLRRHPEDLFLLLFLDLESYVPTLAAAYRPSTDCWLPVHIHRRFSLSNSAGSSATLAVLQAHDNPPAPRHLAVSDIFSEEPPLPIPPMSPSVSSPYVLALLSDGDDFKIVAVDTADRVYCQVYDSRTGKWAPGGEFPGQFAVLGGSAPLDGLLFVLSRGPDHLLTFDPVAHVWSLVDVAMPAVVCSHILEFDNTLFLVGGVEEFGAIVKVGIWKLDRVERDWKEVCFMPDGIFQALRGAQLLAHFDTVDQMGMICFYNGRDSRVLMCDLAARSWWWPPPCHIIPKERRWWFGQALELSAKLLKPRTEQIGDLSGYIALGPQD